MAFVIPSPPNKNPRTTAGAGRAHSGLSPAAQALSPKKPSGFLQLFRKLAGAGRRATAGAQRTDIAPAPGKAGSGAKIRTAEADEFRAQAQKARAARRPRRGGEALPGGRRILLEAGVGAEAAAAPARRPRAAAPQEAVPPAGGPAPQRAQARVVVIDLRTRAAAGQQRASAPEAPERGEAPRSFERAMLAREAGNAAPAEQLPGLPASTPGRAGLPETPGSPGSVPVPALRERLLPEIVHQAGIIIRDGGEGEIRLLLKPEHLGSVRIRLQLGESSLEGRIVVDNSNVKELLEAHLEQLKSALRQEGWASANIDVTLSGGGGGRRELEPEPAVPAVAGRTPGAFERATPAVLDLGFTTVNLLA